MPDIDFAFFGCWLRAGHSYFEQGGISIDNPQSRGLPDDHNMDASSLLLPYPEREGYGACTYLPHLNLTILSWWNRVFDTRGRVNSHVLVRSEVSPTTCWNVLNYRFKEIASHHTKPIIQVRY